MLCCCQTIKVYYYIFSDENGNTMGGIKAFKSIVECSSFIRHCQKKGWDYQAWILHSRDDAELLESTPRLAPIRL